MTVEKFRMTRENRYKGTNAIETMSCNFNKDQGEVWVATRSVNSITVPALLDMQRRETARKVVGQVRHTLDDQSFGGQADANCSRRPEKCPDHCREHGEVRPLTLQMRRHVDWNENLRTEKPPHCKGSPFDGGRGSGGSSSSGCGGSGRQ